MGVIKQGILGGFSGRVGTIVGTSWKGIAVMKALPLSVANPRSAGQVSQRTKFSAVVALASILLSSIIKPLWDRFAQKQSGYNAFVSANVAAFSSLGVLNYASLKTSIGSLLGAPIELITCGNGDNTAVVDWNDNSGDGSALSTDAVYIVILNETKDSVSTLSTGVTRADGTAEVSLNESAATGNKLHAYLSFRRADGTIVSDSNYATITV